MTQLTNGDYYP